MSLVYTKNLIGKKSEPTYENVVPTPNRIGSWSYPNVYDAMYAKYSTDKNFDLDTWQEAFKRGEQDTYLSLLEQNKDNVLSKQFYDEKYKSYESNMLELSLAIADDTNLEERFRQVYDPISNKWVDKSLGEMSDKQDTEYTLAEVYAAREAEITKGIEQWRKDELGWWGRFGSDILATVGEFSEGILWTLSGLADFVVAVETAGLVPYLASGAQGNYLDAFVDYYASGITAAERNSVRAALDEYERLNTDFRDIDGNMTTVGKYVAGISNSIGMMVPAIVANTLTGGAASLAWVGTATFYSAIFSNNMYENATNQYLGKDSPAFWKITNAALKTGAEFLVEYGLGKWLGGTVSNQLIGIKGKLAKNIVFDKKAGLRYLFKSAGQEGLEEFLQDFSTNLIDQFMVAIDEGYGNTGVTFQTLVDSFMIGALSSMVMTGGAVADNAVRTAIQNKQFAEGKSLLPGDTVIETEPGKFTKVSGLNKLYYSSILSDFQNAVDTLKKDKFSLSQNLRLAEEVYEAFTVISQFYSSFDKERIVNCERLLSMVKDSEQEQIAAFESSWASTIPTPETSVQIIRERTKEIQRQRTNNFVNTLSETFTTMLGTTQLKNAIKIKEATENVKEDLEKAEVTEVLAIADNNGTVTENKNSKKAKKKTTDVGKSNLDLICKTLDNSEAFAKLIKGYEFIFVTDGRQAVETGDILFVPINWLENYTDSKIYSFLEQTKILKSLIADEQLKPMIEELIKFDRLFTKQTEVTAEKALMDFLFNESVYQQFLLSNNGKNLKQFGTFIFRIQDMIKALGEAKLSTYKEKYAEQRRNILNKIYEQIKTTMRTGSLKAIINWNLDPQLIGADSILTEADRNFVARYQAPKKLSAEAMKSGPISSQYRRLADEILKRGNFTDKEKVFIQKGLSDKATTRERASAVVMLNLKEHGFGFSNKTDYYLELNDESKIGLEQILSTRDSVITELQTNTDEKLLSNKKLSEIVDDYAQIESNIINISNLSFIEKVLTREEIAIMTAYSKIFRSAYKEFLKSQPGYGQETYKDLLNFITPINAWLDSEGIGLGKILDKISSQPRENVATGTFIVPPMAIGLDDMSIASTQYKIDKLNEFIKEYGTDPQHLIMGSFSKLTPEQIEKIQTDMLAMGVDNLAIFVQRKLETMLGDDYIVTLYSYQDYSNDGVYRPTQYKILKKIDADELLVDNVAMKGKSVVTRNNFFRSRFDATNEVSIDSLVKINGLEGWKVSLDDLGYGNWGTTLEDEKIILLNPKAPDLVHTFVHEVNHAVQSRYGLPGGFNSESTKQMTELLTDVKKNYPEAFDLASKMYPNSNENDILAYLAYLLVQGELWSETYKHNERTLGLIREGTLIIDPVSGKAYRLDGKKIISKSQTLEQTKPINDTQTKNLFKWSFDNVIRTQLVSSEGSTRNTYHSKLTKYSSVEVLGGIVNPGLPISTRTQVTINDIITDPEQYMSTDMLKTLKGNYSEGNVYYRLKEYLESKYDSVSIDRDYNTHNYILVDDNAFDDLLNSETKSDMDNSNTLFEKYGKKKVPLSTFYDQEVLDRLGLSGTITVTISPDVHTETKISKNNIIGEIFIRADSTTTNNEIINRINHEFRHVMQNYGNFEKGFTTDFAVTQDMIDDVKKHVPELFTDEQIKEIAKLNKEDLDTFAVRQFIYLLVGGELNAYGIKAVLLNLKPIYVSYETGKPMIFMPWYDKKTDEGRYTTNFTTQQAKDVFIPTDKKAKKIDISEPKVELTKEEKREQKKKNLKEVIPQVSVEKKVKKSLESRYVSPKNAKGTNLEYFLRKGDKVFMAKDLQEFVIATTGKLDKLPKELKYAVEKGVLTKQSLYKWFRNIENLDNFTFELLNKHIFKNDYITSLDQLKMITEKEPSFYWALAVVLNKEGVSVESLLRENSIEEFMKAVNSLENSTLKEKIDIAQIAFEYQWVKDENDGWKKEETPITDKITKYTRVMTMLYFDGTLAGAFYVANKVRKVLRNAEIESRRGATSFDKKTENKKGEKSLGFDETLTTEDGIRDENLRKIGNDLLALYDLTSSGMSRDKMTGELLNVVWKQNIEKVITDIENKTGASEKTIAQIRTWLTDEKGEALTKGIDAITNKDEITERDKSKLKFLLSIKTRFDNMLKSLSEYQEIFDSFSNEEIAEKYNQLVMSEVINKPIEIEASTKNPRAAIVSKIKSAGTRLLNLMSEGKLSFESLPKEVQDMFELKTDEELKADIDKGKKLQKYKLKASTYSVGRGRASLYGTSDGRYDYVPKHDINKDTNEYRRDVTQILKNLDLLQTSARIARQTYKQVKEQSKENIREVKKIKRKVENLTKREILEAQKSKEEKITEISVERKGKRSKISDTPNVFNIVSRVDMPEKLKTIYDTSFTDMADTRVQYASVNENGELYTKEDFEGKKFDSVVQHEVNNIGAFYDANYQTLESLTREDVLDFINFMSKGVVTVDGPGGKLQAFNIWIMAYILRSARMNAAKWDFSSAEVDGIRQVYEKMSSTAGMMLNAVKQAIDVVDPVRRVMQRSLDYYNIPDNYVESLYNALTKVQNSKTTEEAKAASLEVLKITNEIEVKMAEGDPRKAQPWTKKWYQYIKSFRFTTMLSSPITWVRNIVSNVALQGLNKASDAIGNFIFTKKGYTKEQWNLQKVQVSEKVKTFIDNNIKNSELLGLLYGNTTKYDDNMLSKYKKDRQDLFTTMITRAIEQKYAANHKFDNKTMQLISNFVNARISDERFIRHATNKYLSKILTIESENGRLNLEAGLSDAVLNLFAESVILANRDYMHKDSFASDMLRALKSKSPVAYEILSAWQPFLNSSLNWFGEMLNYTPVGLINNIIRMSKLEQQITNIETRRANGETLYDSRATEYLLRRNVGKGVVGTIFTIVGMLLSVAGVLKLEEDDNKFYVVAGDVKFDISNIFGTSSILIGASLAQIGKKSFDQIMLLATDQLFEGFVINDLLARHKWDTGFYEFLLTEGESVLRSFVPQAVQLIVRAFNNEKIKYTAGMAGMWERWLNTFVITQPFGDRKVNPYTGENETKHAIPVLGELLKSGLFGPKIFWSVVSENERLCRELGVNKEELTGQLLVSGTEYTLDKTKLNKKYGELNAVSLSEIQTQKHLVQMENGKFKTIAWSAMTDTQKANVAERTMVENALIAKIYMWTSEGHKYYASNELWQQLRKSGITHNIYRGDKGFVK